LQYYHRADRRQAHLDGTGYCVVVIVQRGGT
jgi:hypothetical protein